MSGVVEIGGAILSRSLGEAEVAAQNMANMMTMGYRARRSFPQVLMTVEHSDSSFAPGVVATATDFTIGKLVQTGNPLDMAITGNGFFTVRSGSGKFYTRDGQFSRDSEGRLTLGNGMIVQSSSGDIVLGSGDVTLSADGMLLVNGEPVAKLAIAQFDDLAQLRPMGTNVFSAPEDAAKEMADPALKQSMLESSNVSNSTEMLMLMGAIRKAESGQRIIQIYDDLMGKALTSFGEA